MPSRTDSNQAEIVAALRAAGYLVHIESAHRGHKYDLVVRGLQQQRMVFLLEVKGHNEKLTPNEAEFYQWWPVAIVHDPAEAQEILRAMEAGL